MGYEAPHAAAKYSAITEVVVYLSELSLVEGITYIFVMSFLAYSMTRLKKKRP